MRGAINRGDDAMALYGLSKFLLFQGDRPAAEALWPLIEMSAASVLKHTTAAGIVASKTDEMEGRSPTGDANLSTASLACGGFRLAARVTARMSDKLWPQRQAGAEILAESTRPTEWGRETWINHHPKPPVNPILILSLALLCAGSAVAAEKWNVLLLMADDLRGFGGTFTREVVKAPNLDRLAARGVRFEQAFAQYPVCNPSRTSLLLGLRCEQTGIVGNQQFFRDRLPDAVTLPQWLRQHGWTTRSFGKIFHAANTGEALRQTWLDIGKSWDHAEILPANSPHRRGEFRNLTGGKLGWCEIGIVDGPEDEQPDARTATAAIRSLEELSAAGTPWMVAAGFHRPHDPFHAPRKYFDLYPKDALRLYRDPAGQSKPPALALTGTWVQDFAKFTDDDRLDFLRAYLAGMSFTDAQVGRLLDTLDRLKLWDHTLVIFLGDHGYHLGERGWWNKNTLFDRSCRAPLIIAAPGMNRGQLSRSLVELVDLYPTVADFCGLKMPHPSPGVSLRPILADPSTSLKDAAFTLVTRGPKQRGQSVRTARWRFTLWSDGQSELYDHATDPEETRDVASQHPEVVKTLAERIGALPKSPP